MDNKNLFDALAKLAEKLGTSIDYIWPKLIYSVKLDAIIAVISCSVLGLCLTCAGFYFIKKYKEEGPYSMYDIAFVFSFILALASFAIALCNISNVIMPEAQAFQNVIRILK